MGRFSQTILPQGVELSSTVPTSLYVGKLWRNTSAATVAGVPPNITASYNGTSWDFIATPIEAGSVLFHTGTTAPTGYLKANGVLLSRTVYASLFSFANSQGLVTEAAWTAGSSGRYSVGDGTTTFRIPDLRGEFLRGWDDSRGVDAGRAMASNQASQNLSHTHDVVRYGQLLTRGLGGDGNFWEATTAVATSASGGSESRPRNVAVLICIKF